MDHNIHLEPMVKFGSSSVFTRLILLCFLYCNLLALLYGLLIKLLLFIMLLKNLRNKNFKYVGSSTYRMRNKFKNSMRGL